MKNAIWRPASVAVVEGSAPGRPQKSEATHKLYRRWMSALLESSQAHLEAKDEVRPPPLSSPRVSASAIRCFAEPERTLAVTAAIAADLMR